MKKLVPKSSVLIPGEAECVFRGHIYDVYQWPQKMFDGSTQTFEMLKRPDTVTIIPVIEGKIMIIEDKQPHSGTRLSFPGGRVDVEGEDVQEAAKREVKEETGWEFDHWRLVRVSQPHSKLEWFIYSYIAWGGKKTSSPHLDVGEKITLKELVFNEAKDKVLAGIDYLGESADLFKRANNAEELINLPEFEGLEVDR